MHRAVEHVGDAERLPAGDRVANAALHAAAGGRPRRHGGAGDDDEVGGVAAVERQLLDALVLDDLPDRRAARFDQRRGRLDRDRLAQLTERQRDVDDGVGIDLEDDAGLLEAAEAGEADLEPVRPDRQVGQRVGALGIGDDRPPETGVGLDGGDIRARQYAAALIADGAVDLRRRANLGIDDDACEQNKQQSTEQLPQGTSHSSLLASDVDRTKERWVAAFGGEYTRGPGIVNEI